MAAWWTALDARGRLLAGLVAAIVLVGAVTAVAAIGKDGGDETVTADAGSASSTSSTSSASTTSSAPASSSTSVALAGPGASTTSTVRSGTKGATTTTGRRGGGGPSTTVGQSPVLSTTPTTHPAPIGSCNTSSAGAAGQLADLYCARRASKGLALVRRTGALDAVAQEWAEKLARDHALSHRTSADMKARVLAACTSCTGWAENVAYDQNVTKLWNAWLASTTHRNNIDDPHAGEFGMGAAMGDDGYLYAVQNFGRYP
jgi:uncharacterized protein YkwD